ncbi:MAG: transglutaminase-like domain-containing protein [Paraglaciecola sp.]|uniref:transglutaminase-like domain-containing protein n=1 Tax=Paraglaciecola sp. TaxID=1920173 RepID=UPI003299D4F7
MKYIAAVLICLVSTMLKAQSTPLLAEQTIVLHAEQRLPLGDQIGFDVVTSKPTLLADKLEGWSNIKVTQVEENGLSIIMTAKSKFLGKPISQYSASSFVIDIDELETQSFIASFVEDNKDWGPNDLAAYVSGYIKDTTYIHGFHIASVVAKQASGDCTEFAVLVTALARGLGLPARLIMGTVIIEQENNVSSYGHAWAEVYSDDKWHLVDAALYGSEAKHHFYLPASELQNEGPGYVMSIARGAALMSEEITNLKSH